MMISHNLDEYVDEVEKVEQLFCNWWGWNKSNICLSDRMLE